MLILNEETCRRLLGIDAAAAAVEEVFAAMARGEATNFPVVREDLGHAGALFGFKSGFDKAGLTLGVKVGGYWPDNEKRNLTNHQSTVCLFDPDSGQLIALVAGNYLTALRTAAASAVSIRYLAREDAEVLGMIGAGFQSPFQLRAAVRQRRFKKLVAWNPHPEMLSRLAEAAAEIDLPFEAVELDALGAAADVIITITSSFAPLLKKADVKPGTHIACMGTDTRGKQEVAAELLAAAAVFTDEVSQAVAIGESQHAIQQGLISEDWLVPLGAVINADHAGRSDAAQITLFDGTGVALQDLAVAGAVVRRACSEGAGVTVET
ncbi:iminosuccinate reductase BhcD [Pseudohoeflea coraliihabitans]|uniref:Ornithine cyclodeaminase family protein n=1 Tax=Pseudohoeflea coraliihabitans TaxID=2860393 RepID=A0ABS6WQY6_9HYPH|nr:iminosuccinate reductase BhcD [Pseudohoeflea sp. DP4N28-3]MBW3098335.1 ornithine cyclodeaminase family protein [Pseudohoeflea sp. DP4N28-3]